MRKFEKISDEEWKANFAAMRAALGAYYAAMFARESYDTAEWAALEAYNNAAIRLYKGSHEKEVDKEGSKNGTESKGGR